MTKTRKILVLAVSMMLIVAISIGATYAYLTSTASVVNTFTVGKVEIDLDEAKTDINGVAANMEDRVKANKYKLMPGHSYTKDPTVTVKAGSEASWVFIKVVNEISEIEDAANTIAAQIEKNGWTPLNGEDGVYYKSMAATTKDEKLVVFESFKLKDDLTNEQIAAYAPVDEKDEAGNVTKTVKKTVTITAYAIQADGFTTANAAWEAGNWN